MSSPNIPQISRFQFLPPFKNSEEFEEFVTAFFNSLEKTNSYNLFGKTGQAQYGLDVYSIEKETVIQCKCKDIGRRSNLIRRELLKSLLHDFALFEKYNDSKGYKFRRFVFASTHCDDSHIADKCIELSNDKINVEYWSWDTLLRHGSRTSEVFSEFYGGFHYSVDNNLDFKSTNETTSRKIQKNQLPISFKIDKSKPIVDQLYDFISFKFSETASIPIHLLADNYPFKESNFFYPYYFSFSLTTDNEELFEFFESIRIENSGDITFTNEKFIQGVDDYVNKTKTILSKMTDNLVFDLQSNKTHKQIEIRYSFKERCDCIECKLARFEFAEAFKMLTLEPKDIDGRFSLAFANYQIGNFLKAAMLLKEIAGEYADQKSSLHYFKALYNLTKLKTFIKYQYAESDTEELLNFIDQIDLDEIYVKYSTNDSKGILRWIKSNLFYSENRDKVQTATSKIRDVYDNVVRGGWNSSNLISPLVNQYAEADSFINRNHLVFDAFSEYEDMTDIFIEGLFASHATKKFKGIGLATFDDWLVIKMIQYAKPEKILLFFNRYHLKELNYKSTSKDGDSFLELLLRYLENSAETKAAFEKYCEKENWHFWQKYKPYLGNMVVLAALFDLDTDKVNRITRALLKFIQTKKSLYTANVYYIKIFIKRKGEQISVANLMKILFLVLDNKFLHEADILEETLRQIGKHQEKVNFSVNEVKKFEALAFEKCSLCKHTHSPLFIVPLYKAIDDAKIREDLKNRILGYLKANVATDLFYVALVENVVDFDEDLFSSFIEAVKPKSGDNSLKAIFTGTTENRFLRVNQLLDICFKFELDLKDSRFSEFSKIDPYYEWLFNLGTFDYALFDARWICEHKTVCHFKELGKYQKIRDNVGKYLRDNFDPQVERAFAQIACSVEE